VKVYTTFYLLQYLMNMAIEDRNRAESLNVREGLGTVIFAPAVCSQKLVRF
jgi:hypothetical protein